MFSSFHLKRLLFSLAISLGTGGIAALFAMNAKEVYGSLTLPWFAPPAWIFGPVWTVLYIFLGLASYMVYESACPAEKKRHALTFYGVMLVLNFLWTPLFFRLQTFSLAFVELCALLVLTLVTTVLFAYCKPKTLWLMLPYVGWLVFAAALNRAVAALN